MMSCATYYQLNFAFNQDFERGNMEGAQSTLNAKSKKLAKGKERFLYHLNQGTVAALLDQMEESNAHFEKAFIYGEDYQVNYANEIGAFLVNPTVVAYKGEDHEHLMLLYYKALNYLKLGDHESALIECRRLDVRLQQLSDKYKSDRKYKRDAFVHTLMGLIYDADHDYNNAFIAYRNAYNIYQEDYQNLFGLGAPNQLKKDLLRTAYQMGFHTELKQYEKEFEMKYVAERGDGDLIFFWNNGLGPVKYEYSINFSLIHGEAGYLSFESEVDGLTFPFWLDDTSEQSNGFSDLEFYRITIPRYRARIPRFDQGFLSANGKKYSLNKGEDISKIAMHSLDQRMGLELSKSLLRLAIKKAAENELRKEDEGLGTALGILNALTEKTDTRNWQTIPHAIYYTRVPLNEGKQEVNLHLEGAHRQSHSFNFSIKKNQTTFHSFYSLESMPPRY